ncbi:hypothetical protein Tco_0863778 [Tanacetum coccineum]
MDRVNKLFLTFKRKKKSLMQTVFFSQNDFKKEESRNIDREIALEKRIKQLDNIVFKRDQSAQTVHMLTKPQFFYDHTTKQALGFQNPFYLKKAQQLEPKLYVGDIIEKTNPIVIPDSEETLMLAEESRSKMLLKQKDPMMLEKKVNTTPVDYAALNQLYKDFETRFVPQTELSAEQAFWSQNSVNSPEPILSNRPTVVESKERLKITWYVKLVQELLTNIGKTFPSVNNTDEKLVAVTPKNKDKRVRFTEPVTTSGNTITKTTSPSNLVSNKPMLSSIGVKSSASASGSQYSDFDELTAMASEHSSSGPALHEMTPATISSRLVPNPPPSTPFVPPSRTEVVAPIHEVVALVSAESTGSPLLGFRASTLSTASNSTDISKITRKPSKTGKHGHEKRKSTREAKDSKPKPRKVNQ